MKTDRLPAMPRTGGRPTPRPVKKTPRRGALSVLCTLGAVAMLGGCAPTPAEGPGEGSLPCAAFSGQLPAPCTFSEPLTLDFGADAGAKADFNRFTLLYTLSGPVRGQVVYQTDDGAYNEEFYLSETQNTFSQLIDGYLQGKTAQRLSSITLEPLLAGPVTLQLQGAALDTLEVLPDVLEVENDRYRLGVKLSWGGGISLLQDKRSPREDIGNLLNCHDTGRLIQQSYYGVREYDSYENGRFMDSRWAYNPVQGGDQYGNRSKIVDVRYTENSVTVVSRPLDWAKDNCPTQAYYTNTYTLDKDVVRVDNTVLDFSGYPHADANQELPAFYTVSALGNFVYYGGRAPWSGDTLTWRRELPFWAGEPDCECHLSPDNTECWCAWVDDSDYGVGLYTPGVEVLYAGRFAYNGSTSPDDDATNYVAPLCVLTLPCYRPLSYSYLLAAGTVEELRAAFSARQAFATNDDLRQPLEGVDFTALTFGGEEDFVCFGASNQTRLQYADGCAVLQATESQVADPYIALRYAKSEPALDAQDFPYLVLTYRTDAENSDRADTAELFLATDAQRTAKAGCSQRFALETDGEFHSQVLQPGGLPYWDGRINLLRLDYFSDAREGDTFRLYSLLLAKDEQEAQRLAEQQLAAAKAAATPAS